MKYVSRGRRNSTSRTAYVIDAQVLYHHKRSLLPLPTRGRDYPGSPLQLMRVPEKTTKDTAQDTMVYITSTMHMQ